MYNDLGEEIILDIHRIPWLIRIHLLVLFLLILLLSYFGLFSLDFSALALSSPPSSNISSAVVLPQAVGGQETQTERSIQRGIEGNSETDGSSSAKDFRRLFHPCFYLDLAKKAFLQCLGLGSTPTNPRE